MSERYGGSSLYQAVMKRLEMPTRLVTRSVNVDTRVTEVLSANPRRIAFVITNCNFEACLIGFSSDINPNNAFIIAPNGGTVTADYLEDGETCCYNVYARFLETSGYLYVAEVIAL